MGLGLSCGIWWRLMKIQFKMTWTFKNSLRLVMERPETWFVFRLSALASVLALFSWKVSPYYGKMAPAAPGLCSVSFTREKKKKNPNCSSNCLRLTFIGSNWPGLALGSVPWTNHCHQGLWKSPLDLRDRTDSTRADGLEFTKVLPLKGGIDSWQSKNHRFRFSGYWHMYLKTISVFKELTVWCSS